MQCLGGTLSGLQTTAFLLCPHMLLPGACDDCRKGGGFSLPIFFFLILFQSESE